MTNLQRKEARMLANKIYRTIKTVVALLAIGLFFTGVIIAGVSAVKLCFSVSPMLGGLALALCGGFFFVVYGSIEYGSLELPE